MYSEVHVCIYSSVSVTVCTVSVRCMLGLFVRNPLNSDMDNRTFNVHKIISCNHSYAIYTWGVGHTTISQHILDSETLSQIILVLLTGFKPRVIES